MKKQVFFLMMLCSVFVFTACTSNSPTSVVKKFTESIAKGKFEDAKKYCTDPTAKIIDMAITVAGDTKTIKEDFEFIAVSEVIDGDKATVTYKEGKDSDTEETVELIKVDGAWKVNMGLKK